METRSEYLFRDGYPPWSSPQEAQLEYGYDQPSTSGCGPSAPGNGQPPPEYGQLPPRYSPQEAQLEYGYDQPSTSGCGQPPPGYEEPPPRYGQRQEQSVALVVITQPSRRTIIQPEVPPPDYMCLAMVSCFFCWPLAILAINAASNSSNSSAASNFALAKRQGRSARNIAIAAILISIILTVGMMVYFIKIMSYKRVPH